MLSIEKICKVSHVKLTANEIGKVFVENFFHSYKDHMVDQDDIYIYIYIYMEYLCACIRCKFSTFTLTQFLTI